jgi:hypothetical protein
MRLGVAAAWGLGLVSVGIGAALVTSGLQGPSDRAAKPASLLESCPPQVSIAPRGPGQPVDDDLGVRLGFTISDVSATLKCLDDGYKIRFEPVWHSMDRSSATDQRQLMYAERAREVVAAGYVGAPGQERAAALWRTVRYDLRDEPDLAAVQAELSRHFGPPHAAETIKLRRTLIWSYDPNGLPLKPSPEAAEAGVLQRVGSWIAGTITVPQCSDSLRASPLDRPGFSASCGLTIRADITMDAQAPTKVSEVKVALADQARAKSLIEAYRASQTKR